MIKIQDIDGRDFWLLKTRAADYGFFAAKSAIQDAARPRKNGYYREFSIYNRSSKLYVMSVVFTRLSGSRIELGCHEFDRKNSAILRKWLKS